MKIKKQHLLHLNVTVKDDTHENSCHSVQSIAATDFLEQAVNEEVSKNTGANLMDSMVPDRQLSCRYTPSDCWLNTPIP